MKKCILSIIVNTIVGVVLSILLLELCQNFISNIIVSNIFDKMDFSNKVVKVMSFLALLMACARLIYKSIKNDIPDIKLVSGVFIATFVYTYFRVCSHDNWYFVNFYNNIKYCDAIYLIFTILSSIVILIPIKKHHKFYNKIINTIYSRRHFETVLPNRVTPKVSGNDVSISTPEEDKFNFYPSVINLLKRIIEGSDYYKERAMCIGLSASWGSGKTSYLNLLQYAIEKDKNSGYYKQAIIVKFNPWFSSNSNRMVQDFMITLSKALNEYNPNISSELIHYSKILSKAQLGWFSNLIDICFNTKEDAIEKQFAEISECINLIRKPIIIFIDDIDRLQPEEIIRVLQLVRNTANFKNSIFIIPYDETYIKEAMNNLNVSEKYLEKILTQPHHLPLIQQEQMKLIISDIVSNIILASDEEIEMIRMFVNDIDIVFSIRSIKRLINQLLLTKLRLSSLGLEDMYLYDLLIIEYLHLEYEEIYEIILNVGDSFIKKEIKLVNDSESELIHNLTDYTYYEKEIQPKIQKGKDKKLGHKLLKLLFGYNEEKDSNYFRLKNIDIYEIYFEKNTKHKFISKSEFNDIATRYPQKIKEYLPVWVELNNKKLLLYLLGNVRFHDKNTGFTLLNAYLDLVPDNYINIISNKYQDMILIGYDYYLTCKDKEYKSLYKSIIIEYFQIYNIDNSTTLNRKFNVLSFHFANIKNLTKQSIFTNLMWDDYYLLYLKQTISLHNNYPHTIFNYIYTLNTISINKKEDALKLIKEYCNKDFNCFIRGMNELDESKYEIILSSLFPNSQNDWLSAYQSFLENHSNDYSQDDWYKNHLKKIKDLNFTSNK